MSALIAQALLQSLPGVTALVVATAITVGHTAKDYAGGDAIVLNANGGTAEGATGRSNAAFMVHVYSADAARADAICAAIRGGLRGLFTHGGVTAAGVRVHGVASMTMPQNTPERYEGNQVTRIFNFSLKLWEG